MNRADRRAAAKESRQMDTLAKHRKPYSKGVFAAYFTKHRKKERC